MSSPLFVDEFGFGNCPFCSRRVSVRRLEDGSGWIFEDHRAPSSCRARGHLLCPGSRRAHMELSCLGAVEPLARK